MHVCKSYFFGQAGWGGTVCVLNVFIFVSERSINLKKKTRMLQKDRKKPSYLSELIQVLWGLLSLLSSKYFQEKIKCIMPHLSHNLSHNTTVWEHLIMVAKETMLTANPPTERKSKLFDYS